MDATGWPWPDLTLSCSVLQLKSMQPHIVNKTSTPKNRVHQARRNKPIYPQSHFKPLWFSSWPLSQVDFQLIMPLTTWLAGLCAGDASLSLPFSFLHFNNAGEWLMINQITIHRLTLIWCRSLHSFCMESIFISRWNHWMQLCLVWEHFKALLEIFCKQIKQVDLFYMKCLRLATSLTQCFQKFLEIFRRLHCPFPWEICNFLLHYDASARSDVFCRWEAWMRSLRLVSVWLCLSVNRFVKPSPLPASAPAVIGWQRAWMLVQPMQRPVTGRDFPPLVLTVACTSVSMVKDLDTSWKMHFQ